MNRKKKINQILVRKAKKAKVKTALNNTGASKPRYISKADRAKMEAETEATKKEKTTDSN